MGVVNTMGQCSELCVSLVCEIRGQWVLLCEASVYIKSLVFVVRGQCVLFEVSEASE